MAEFCTTCAEKFEMHPDFDIQKSFKKLKSGYQMEVFCEGCATVALRKNEDGTKEIAVLEKNGVTWKRYYGTDELV